MNKGVELQVKQMIQVLLGSENVNADIVYMLEELHKQGLLSEIELHSFQQNLQLKKGIASC
ncbi:hypothetical protein SIL04_05325 [Bacillus cereus group sp. BfR-BA-00331]|uniref:hypothetical protein n=1 Tax=unclassified Bacillus cereus group TaxID=2750818 RepID=UPI000772B2B2|nr:MULTISPECIES: hypothetical protein [unclassified Bacillus cereus group]MDA1631828.1 hypothetical protein [Bacillus cereus]MDA2755995.1 hypothetical protein [Bacillus cereus group sp. Bc007]MDA2762037.1 hypothetical protein [Bacillus cereus group sp. Bc008]MDA2772794.1 hypothetical protein [Bacillus cereus group sp. Bc005]MDX5957019.1 hypothetical protein [Bacillus cereus group sp. BfR-BA-00331]